MKMNAISAVVFASVVSFGISAMIGCSSSSTPDATGGPNPIDASVATIDAPVLAIDAALHTPDAHATPDAAAFTDVTVVSCNGTTPIQSVTMTGGSYSPRLIAAHVGDVVQYTTTSDHDVSSQTRVNNTPVYRIGFSTTGCLQFNTVGSYTYDCSIHGFTGTVTVTQ